VTVSAAIAERGKKKANKATWTSTRDGAIFKVAGRGSLKVADFKKHKQLLPKQPEQFFFQRRKDLTGSNTREGEEGTFWRSREKEQGKGENELGGKCVRGVHLLFTEEKVERRKQTKLTASLLNKSGGSERKRG